MKVSVMFLGLISTGIGVILLFFGNEYGGIPLLTGPVLYMMAGK
jgi:hypothetical protein